MEKIFRLLYPMRITLISCAYKGKDNWMAASWCFPLSASPPLFGVCIAKKRFSYNLIHKSRQFVINIPGENLKETVKEHGRLSGANVDKFAVADLTREKGKLDAPLIKECLASIECRVISEDETGDHTLFIGEVVNVIKRSEGNGIYHLGGNEIVTFCNTV